MACEPISFGCEIVSVIEPQEELTLGSYPLYVRFVVAVIPPLPNLIAQLSAIHIDLLFRPWLRDAVIGE